MQEMLYQKIFLFGIDKAGKTCLSEAMRTGKTLDSTEPTVKFDIKTLFLENFKDSVEFRIWDAPGQKNYRDSWGAGVNASNMIIFVLDTTEKKRFLEARAALEKILNAPETIDVPLIFLFHKMDDKKAIANYEDAVAVFDLPSIKNRSVHALATSIKDPTSIDKVKVTIAEIVAKARRLAPE